MSLDTSLEINKSKSQKRKVVSSGLVRSNHDYFPFHLNDHGIKFALQQYGMERPVLRTKRAPSVLYFEKVQKVE